MIRQEIDKLLSEGEFPETGERKLVETHISWVILGQTFAFKIKKPVHYPFLDFSTIEKRKYYCDQEIVLNNRLTQGLYIDVLPIKENNGQLNIGGTKGNLVDYAVRMNKLDTNRQMNVLLGINKVTSHDIGNLAGMISRFHKRAIVIKTKDYLDVQSKFSALSEEKDFLGLQLGRSVISQIEISVDQSDAFIRTHRSLLESRLRDGFFRDVHGDLHARNIFLLPEPVIFDCIEFNDEYRQIDTLNEVAFLCMDLDVFGFKDLSEQFISAYNLQFPSMKTEVEKRLFIYYKSYRANVRAKVNSFRARSASDHSQRDVALAEANRYLRLMANYLAQLQ